MTPDVPSRGVVRERLFERQAAAIRAHAPRLEEAFEYLDFRLANEPHSGLPSAVPGIWVAPIRVPADTGVVRASVFYTFTDSAVHYQSIVQAP